MKQVFDVVGELPISVESGHFRPGARGVSLSDAEAKFLTATGAVTPRAVPAMGAGADVAETSGLSEQKPLSKRKEQ